MKGKLV